jgi:hypothetical protein
MESGCVFALSENLNGDGFGDVVAIEGHAFYDRCATVGHPRYWCRRPAGWFIPGEARSGDRRSGRNEVSFVAEWTRRITGL